MKREQRKLSSQSSYCPKLGDIISINFDPQAGREQSGRRPAIVLSSLEYNSKTDLAIVCPITSKLKAYPFEVKIPDGFDVYGAVLSDHIKSLSWKDRDSKYICDAPPDVIEEVKAKIAAILDFN
jgi:mRNA interferase MazF